MNKFIFAFLFLLSLGIFYFSNVSALTVDVFTTSNKVSTKSVVLNPLPKSAIAHVYYIDQLRKLQEGINRKISHGISLHDNARLKQATKKWVNAHKAAYLKMASDIQAIYQDNVTQIPAIVFDHRYTVLGTNDINQAYQFYLNKVGDRHD